MSGPPISVEVVTHRTQMRRFADVPYLLFGDDPLWSRGVRAYETWRVDEGRHPFFERGTAAYFLARVGGRPAGRVTAHLAVSGDEAGWFGFLAVPDDVAVTAALLDAAQEWLSEQGADSMTGPVSWTADEEFGVPTHGADVAGVTGRPWHPGYYADHLRELGLDGGEVRHTYRLSTSSPQAPSVQGQTRDRVPPHAGRFADDRIVLEGIAAVPDVTATLADVSIRSAWRRARDASQRRFTTAVCVRCDGDPEALVPELVAAAGAASYSDVVVPWAPPGTEPETSHQVFSRRW